MAVRPLTSEGWIFTQLTLAWESRKTPGMAGEPSVVFSEKIAMCTASQGSGGP